MNDRIEGDLISINKSLRPLSWLYGLVVGCRNMLFEIGILKSRSFTIPVISVGNITVGGTGKTPHVEYLIRLLKDKAKVAVLSRGYKRKSHGFVLAGKETTMSDIGDEPFQMLQKFPDITVAVDKKRTRGIDKLTSGEYADGIDVVLLDDASSTVMSSTASTSCSSITTVWSSTTNCYRQADSANPSRARTGPTS